METKFNFNSQVCTSKVQSKRLLALGLKIETADCYHWQETNIYGDGNGKWHCEILSEYNKDHNEYLYNVYGVDGSDEGFFIPAWSLHRLIEMIQDAIVNKNGNDDNLMLDISGIGLYDGTIDGIAELIKVGYFNKEYLV